MQLTDATAALIEASTNSRLRGGDTNCGDLVVMDTPSSAAVSGDLATSDVLSTDPRSSWCGNETWENCSVVDDDVAAVVMVMSFFFLDGEDVTWLYIIEELPFATRRQGIAELVVGESGSRIACLSPETAERDINRVPASRSSITQSSMAVVRLSAALFSSLVSQCCADWYERFDESLLSSLSAS